MRFKTFSEIKEGLKEIFGTAGSTIIYLEAVKAGRMACRRRVDVAGSREAALKLLVEDKARQNWGEISFENLDMEKGSGKILIKNSLETRTTKSDKPVCYFFKGYLVGFLTELLQREVSLSEDRCAAKGDSHCEFTLSIEKLGTKGGRQE